jgi:GNAT superfamily N-acetyltransferase
MQAPAAEAVPAAEQEEVFGSMGQMGRVPPTEPHWDLPFIGVDVTKQSRGYGSALLRHALERCDRDRLPAYLDATSPLNKPLYERHGFEELGVIQKVARPRRQAAESVIQNFWRAYEGAGSYARPGRAVRSVRAGLTCAHQGTEPPHDPAARSRAPSCGETVDHDDRHSAVTSRSRAARSPACVAHDRLETSLRDRGGYRRCRCKRSG